MENSKPQVRFNGFDEDWESGNVGLYYDFKNGLNKGKEYFGYGTPIVNFTDVFHNRSLYIDKLKGKVDVNSNELKNYSVRKGDLFFTRTSETIEEIGFPSVMLDDSENTVFSGFVLRARPLNLDPLVNDFKKYAFYIESFRSEMVKKSSMTTRALTSGTAIKKMLFSFPENKEEQQKIGNFFDNLDKLLTEHQQKHTKLKALKKAMLSKMLPQQGQTVPEIRFKGFSGDWEEKKLNEFSTYHSSTLSIGNALPNGKYKLYDANNVIGYSNINGQPCNYISIIKDGSGVGRVRLLSKKTSFIGTMGGIRAFESDINFLYCCLLITDFSIYITGATIPHIYYSSYGEKEYYIPSEDEQKMIGNYFKNIDNLIDQLELQISKLHNIKKAFLTKMFI